MKLRHVGLVVDSLADAVEWYRKFDFYPLLYEEVKIAGKAVQLCKLAHAEGTEIELLDGSSAVPHISITVSRLLFEVLQENEDTKLFKKEGVCYIRDPWGNTIEIVQERGF